MAEFKEGDIIRHYKRDLLGQQAKDKNKYLYKVIAFATHTETEEELMIYQALYHPFKCYARPMYMVRADVPKDRFKKDKFTEDFYIQLQEKVFELYTEEQ